MSTSANPPKRTFPVWPVLIGAIVVAGILAVVLTSGGGGDKKRRRRRPG